MDEPVINRFFYEIFHPSLPRLGPGDDASTIRALNRALAARCPDTAQSGPAQLRILDVGCGNGSQTIRIARHLDRLSFGQPGKNLNWSILAVDNHQPFLDELRCRAEAEDVSGKIRTYLKDMRHLGLPRASFDLIWSEGALYIMGFRQALEACHDLLLPGGILAASELCWLRPDPPAACRDFFARDYPAMVAHEANLAMIRDCGFRPMGDFPLPETAWLASYYAPLEARLRLLRDTHVADPARLAILDSVQEEITMYRRHARYYGYVFYLMQRE